MESEFGHRHHKAEAELSVCHRYHKAAPKSEEEESSFCQRHHKAETKSEEEEGGSERGSFLRNRFTLSHGSVSHSN